jgi:hypothetical protein
MLIRIVLIAFALLAGSLAHAASSVQLVTPQAMSVAGGESQVFTVRFFDALGAPSVGEAVRYSNDACGTVPGGGFFFDTHTDATGTAAATFTAMNPPGITCTLFAVAGVSAKFAVHTYLPSVTRVVGSLNPVDPRPGEPITVLAKVQTGSYDLYNLDVAARVIAGSASASLSASTKSTGSTGAAEFAVTPDGRMGDYDIELSFRGKTQRITVAMPANPLQDMWWAGREESGWGMSVVQHAAALFSVIYAYDAAGKPTWYVMPTGTWDAAHTSFSGAVYVPHGAPYSAYDTGKFVAGAPVGNVTLTFLDATTASLDYTIGGIAGHRTIQREVFGVADSTASADVGDMWWGGFAQNGWGIAVLKQHRSLFSVWFTYDAAGAPTWFVMPSGYWSDANTWEGHIYRTTGSPWVGRAYDAGALQVNDVGGFRYKFAIEGATFDYIIDGKSGTMALVRQPF